MKNILNKIEFHYTYIIISNIYEKNISFTKIKKLYNKYLGGIEPLDKTINNVTPVFNEELAYTNQTKYHDGVKLTVDNNYLVPSLEGGLVIYIGQKDNYGQVVIIEDINGIDIWYGNLSNVAVKLYDYVEKGSLLGEVNNRTLYLVYVKDGKFLNYEEYLK